MITFINDEQKREFIKAFNECVDLERKKKRIQADSKVVLNDFFNTTFTGLDKYSRKLKKKEFSKCTKTKQEVRTDAEPVETIESVRVQHLEVPDNALDYYDDIVEDTLKDKADIKRIGVKQKELMAIMGKYIIETDEVRTAIIKQLINMAFGKINKLDRINTGVEEGKAILFNVEATEGTND